MVQLDDEKRCHVHAKVPLTMPSLACPDDVSFDTKRVLLRVTTTKKTTKVKFIC
jgi:hypothetical protein